MSAVLNPQIVGVPRTNLYVLGRRFGYQTFAENLRDAILFTEKVWLCGPQTRA